MKVTLTTEERQALNVPLLEWHANPLVGTGVVAATVESILAARIGAALRHMIEVARRQTDLTELVHFDKPSDFRKGVLTVIVALEAAAAEYDPEQP